MSSAAKRRRNSIYGLIGANNKGKDESYSNDKMKSNDNYKCSCNINFNINKKSRTEERNMIYEKSIKQ